MRKDALHNRERLLGAARRLFADRGLEAPLEEIARAAGVSIGTLYNRFPDRQALVEAVFADRVRAVAELAERALAMDDAWEGFAAFLTGVCELQSADLGYNDLVARAAPLEGERGYALMGELVERARRDGGLRADVELADLAFVLWGVAATIRATRATAPAVWRRHLALALDGLRGAGAHALPVPALTVDEVRAAMGEC
ncbi:TetR/AcrR family transcriptional regulator [Nonomuraea soli]|uniref:AcrR family transcriptional regulator n=1 Tax=Nonomuraea soli TaxID=1032476 RepID=A0A7W0HPQ6_9ACTN|nr:helix-turn-helix domain-containing protein [Nonomuraea soli]MBA2891115.1 AcrR family transcriptional regulator [Nonomuraea soli]